MEQGENKAVKWLKHRIVPLFLSFISLFYVFFSTVDIEMADYTIAFSFSLRILTTWIFGMIITTLIGEGGYITGKEDKDYIETRKMAVELSSQVLPFKDEAEEYVSREIDKKIKANREQILRCQGIKYDRAFDENGVCIFDFKDKKWQRSQKKAVRKCKKIVKKQFSLLAFSENDAIGFEEAPSETKRRTKKYTWKVIQRSFFAVITGSVLFTFSGWTLESFLYTMFQLLLWAGQGIMERFDNYNFVVVTMRDYDRSRIGYIKAFLALPIQERLKYSTEQKETPKMGENAQIENPIENPKPMAFPIEDIKIEEVKENVANG